MGEDPRRGLRGPRSLIALDTNLLVYAHRLESEFSAEASDRIRELAEGRAPWAIPWHCVHEFLAVVTHPRLFDPPTPLRKALTDLEAWLASPTLVLLRETAGYWQILRELVADGHATGPRVHDARVAAVCLANGVRELWTADRDFGRFPGLRTHNPLVSAQPGDN